MTSFNDDINKMVNIMNYLLLWYLTNNIYILVYAFAFIF
jgi:hypothetical protein